MSANYWPIVLEMEKLGLRLFYATEADGCIYREGLKVVGRPEIGFVLLKRDIDDFDDFPNRSSTSDDAFRRAMDALVAVFRRLFS